MSGLSGRRSTSGGKKYVSVDAIKLQQCSCYGPVFHSISMSWWRMNLLRARLGSLSKLLFFCCRAWFPAAAGKKTHEEGRQRRERTM